MRCSLEQRTDFYHVPFANFLKVMLLVRVQDAGGTQTPECHFGDGIIRGTQVMYFEKDHLGSVRAVLNTSGTVLEKNDYYPFGMRHANASHVVTANNRYKFNGKEDQTVGALGLLDYGARMYDSQIARWLTVDPLAEKYYSLSPYQYVANSPINAIDPDGKKIIFVNGYLGFGSPQGGSVYWGGVNSSFVRGAQTFFNDNVTPFFTDVK